MDLVKCVLEQHNIEHFGFADLDTPASLHIYEAWLDQGLHGDMHYLREHLEMKKQPQRLLKQAAGAIVLTYPYMNDEWAGDFPLKHAHVALYARKMDYHLWLKKKVEALCRDLKSLYPEHDFLGFTDSSPVLERDLANRAGLGWFGKNTCLLDRKRGSLFFIAEIYTSLPLSRPEQAPTEHCGTCTRCIDACPTGAIIADKKLDATKCISYWTIEARGLPPVELREKFGAHFFGCDICQTVCPWNLKLHDFIEPSAGPELVQELRWILTSSNKQLQKAFQSTPLSRAGGRGLKRNAIIVAANLKLKELHEDILSFKDDAYFQNLVDWAATQLSS